MAARTTLKIPDHITTILRNADISGPNKTHLSITEKLDPKTYGECKKVLEMLGGKWNRSAQATIFPKPIKDILAEALDEGSVVNTKNVRQAFYTPAAVADALVEYACLEDEDDRILEPSAGHGALIEAALRAGHSPRFICAIEINPEERKHLQSLVGTDGVETSDFLAYDLSTALRNFHRILLNPPYSNGQDAKHILHALKFLRPGGILVAVVPTTILEKRTGSYKMLFDALRPPVNHSLYEYDTQELPKGSFKESGTDIDTMLLKIIKA